eukprot:COSAG05_NODE_17624_length_322_cov_0.793722_1_plen_94_part_01
MSTDDDGLVVTLELLCFDTVLEQLDSTMARQDHFAVFRVVHTRSWDTLCGGASSRTTALPMDIVTWTASDDAAMRSYIAANETITNTQLAATMG